MKKLDIHSHSTFSHDGQSALRDMINKAYEMNLSYYGVSEHFNFDYSDKLFNLLPYFDMIGYFTEARKLQEEYRGKLNFLVGGEFGFSKNKSVSDKYKSVVEKYQPDYVINSVHSTAGIDFSLLGDMFSKKEACDRYINVVRESLEADYHYDIVAHFEYVLRYVKNGNSQEFLETYEEKISEIFKRIIEKDKILEVNTSSYGLSQSSLPGETLLSLYYKLGGRKISFGSDAHKTDRLADKFEATASMLKGIGFEYLTIPYKKEHLKFPI